MLSNCVPMGACRKYVRSWREGWSAICNKGKGDALNLKKLRTYFVQTPHSSEYPTKKTSNKTTEK